MAEIDSEKLLARRAALEADMVAIGGALQDIDYWLSVLEDESPEEEKEEE